MRRWLLLLTLAGVGLANTGCLINLYSPDPPRRINQLINQSEDLRTIQDEWERIWFTDHPSALTPYRVSGHLQ